MEQTVSYMRRCLGWSVSLVCVICGLMVSGLVEAESAPVRILSMHDPFARAWADNPELVVERLGLELEITLFDYESSNRAIAVNAARRVSAYDLVAMDVVWMGHYGRLNALLPLDRLLLARGMDSSDFISLAWDAGRISGLQLAVPIQPHPEVLLYRRSVLDALDAAPPATTEEVIELASRISEEVPGMYGICWNAASGSALGQQMLHFAGAFGGGVLADDGRFSVSDPAWREAFAYARALVASSPPMIRNMAWDLRIEQFRRGSCGMTYAWGARTAALEKGTSPVAGDVGYLAAPVGTGQVPATPMGVWMLAIPANLPVDRVAAAADALFHLTSQQGAELLLDLGVSALPRPIQDDQQRYPVLDLVRSLDASGELTTQMRPAVPDFQALSEVIGVEAHAALFGKITDDSALERIQQRLNAIGSSAQ